MQANKVDAIYAVREAAERKVRAELAADVKPSPLARDVLLDAQLDLESKTQTAIAACHQCGQAHAPDGPHGSVTLHRAGNVIAVDFRERGDDTA